MTIIFARRATILLLFALFTHAAHSDSIYLVAGSRVDPLDESVIENPVVEIDGERIVSVTAEGDIPEGAATIDLGSSTLLPGLADLLR